MTRPQPVECTHIDDRGLIMHVPRQMDEGGSSMRMWVGYLSLFFATTLEASLPPYFQSTNEIKRILSHEQVLKAIGPGRAIQGVVRNDSGWEVLTESCRLQVDVSYTPREDGRIGPVNFQLKVARALHCSGGL